MPFRSFRINTVDIIVFVKNNSPIKMDTLLKNKRDIDECNPENELTSNAESCSSKKAKPRPTRKYDESYLNFVFSWTGNVDNPPPACVVCGIKI